MWKNVEQQFSINVQCMIVLYYIIKPTSAFITKSVSALANKHSVTIIILNLILSLSLWLLILQGDLHPVACILKKGLINQYLNEI